MTATDASPTIRCAHMNDISEFQNNELNRIIGRRDGLPMTSFVREAISDEVIDELRRRMAEYSNDAGLDWRVLPVIVGFLDSNSDDAINELDDDIALVAGAARDAQRIAATRFLRTRGDEHLGRWYGGLFETWAKATVVERNELAQFDVPLPNGRNLDIVAPISSKPIGFECTVITQDDEDRLVWARFTEEKKADPTKRLSRPGPYDPPDAKGPSPYYSSLRLYAKIYDKLTRDLDPGKAQLADDQPNVILLSFAGWGVDSTCPGVRWALDELFANQPTAPRTAVASVSLLEWLEYTGKRLAEANRASASWLDDHFREILAAPSRVGAVMVFQGSEFTSARINYNARPACAISHAEMAELERLFSRPRRYLPRH
jgi:hypothetical protein